MIKKTIGLCGLNIDRIYEASNGETGLQLLNEKKVDLLFIDINMPVMDGLEMLTNVRGNKNTKDIPVIIVSTESNENRIKMINRAKAEFVHKPFTPELLREKILKVWALQNSGTSRIRN